MGTAFSHQVRLLPLVETNQERERGREREREREMLEVKQDAGGPQCPGRKVQSNKRFHL